MKPLVIPPAAQRDEKSIQMLSAWIAEKGQHCTIKIGFWQDNGREEPSARESSLRTLSGTLPMRSKSNMASPHRTRSQRF